MQEVTNKKKYASYILALCESLPKAIKDAYRKYLLDGGLVREDIDVAVESYAKKYFVDFAGGVAQYKPEDKLPAYKERQNRRNRRVAEIGKLEAQLLIGYLPAIREDDIEEDEEAINCFEEQNILRTMDERGLERKAAIEEIKRSIEAWSAAAQRYSNSIKTKIKTDEYQGFCTYPYLDCIYPSRSTITLVLMDIDDWIYRVGQSPAMMSMLGKGRGEGAHFNDDTSAFDREEALDAGVMTAFFFPDQPEGIKVTKNINWDSTDWKIVSIVMAQAVTQSRHRTERLKARGYMDILSLAAGTGEADAKERLQRLQKTGLKADFPDGSRMNTSIFEAVEIRTLSRDGHEGGIAVHKDEYKVTLSSFVLEVMLSGLLRVRGSYPSGMGSGSLKDCLISELSKDRIRSLVFSASADSTKEYAIGRLSEIFPVAGDAGRQKRAYHDALIWMKENGYVISDVMEDVLDMSGRWTVRWLPLSFGEAKKADGLEDAIESITRNL